MANKNLPPGWGNRNSSAKPDWGNQKKEQPKQESQYISASNDNEKIENPIKPKEISEAPKAEISEQTVVIPSDEKTEEIIAETEARENVSISEQTVKTVSVDEESDTEQAPKKSNAAIVVLIVLLVAAVIALGVFAVLYFIKDKPKEDSNSVSDNVSAIVTETTTTDISTTTTEATTTATETTTTQTTTSTTETTTTTTTATLFNGNDYLGFWHPENDAESELTIHSIDSSTVTFSLWYYRLWSIENLTAIVEQNSAYFYDDEIEGILTFDDDSIRLYVTMSNISGIPSQYEEVYDMRINDSVQYGDGLKYFDNPTIAPVTPNPTGELFALETTMYGQINCHGGTVAGYDSSYICDGGGKSTIRDSLGDTWHISTWRGCYNYGTVWYECYDSDDGDYYGWVDSSYIDFYTYDDGIGADGLGADETASYSSDYTWCPNCTYGFPSTGIGGFQYCPYCAYTWLP